MYRNSFAFNFLKHNNNNNNNNNNNKFDKNTGTNIYQNQQKQAKEVR